MLSFDHVGKTYPNGVRALDGVSLKVAQGEILVIVGIYQFSSWVAFFAATGMILGAAYMLWLYRRVVFGGLVKETLKGIRDMRANEIIAFAPLVALAIVMGVYPGFFLEPMHASVNQLLAQIGAAGTSLALR